MLTPLKLTVPVVDLLSPAVPAKTALTVPPRKSKSLVLVKAPPLPLMVPLDNTTAATVSE